MKRLLSAFLALALCLSLGLTVSAMMDEALISDKAGLLTYQHEKILNEKLNEISRKHNVQIHIVTLAKIENSSANDYVETLYDGLDMGYGENRDGVLLMVSMNPREFRILSNGFANEAIDVYDIGEISDEIAPDLSAGNFYAAFDTFIDCCDAYIEDYVTFDTGENLVIALVIGLVIGLIVVFTLKGQLKSVRMQRRAHDYVKPGSMQLTVCRDLYLYRTVSRVRKQTNSSSGSRSGGSRSVGGGRF